MRVILSPRAVKDLEQIAETIAPDNPRRAATFVAELKMKCLTLSSAPEAFPIAGYYKGASVRRCVHDKYLIFCRVGSSNVTFWRVLHGARDYVRLLGLSLDDE